MPCAVPRPSVACYRLVDWSEQDEGYGAALAPLRGYTQQPVDEMETCDRG